LKVWRAISILPIRFYQNYSGRFPLRQLSVSQIPGTFGQGWPGLLYVSTFSFLPAEITARRIEHQHPDIFTTWFLSRGRASVVGQCRWVVQAYRDQWIDEAMATRRLR